METTTRKKKYRQSITTLGMTNLYTERTVGVGEIRVTCKIIKEAFIEKIDTG